MAVSLVVDGTDEAPEYVYEYALRMCVFVYFSMCYRFYLILLFFLTFTPFGCPNLVDCKNGEQKPNGNSNNTLMNMIVLFEIC